MENNLISIILPLYNSEKTIYNTIKSILNQTYKNFELLIINDGSTDNSLSICNSFNDSRIRIINQDNSGVSSARNNGLRNIKGDYFCFVDSDDCLKNNMLKDMCEKIDKNEPELIICGYEEIKDESIKDYIPYELVIEGKEKQIDFILSNYDKWLITSVWAKLYKNIFANNIAKIIITWIISTFNSF